MAVFVVMQYRHRDLPPYWDGTVHFLAAHTILENGLSPFLETQDTGHPTLLAWLLALLGWMGLPMMTGFHWLSWIFAGTLVAATWRLGVRVSSSQTVGWTAALLVGLNPCVVGQALQFNLDLPMAATGVLALALFAEGRFFAAGASLAFMTLCKLNGLFGVFPFAAMSLWLVATDARFRRRRAVVGLIATCALPVAALALWLGTKYLAVGRLFDSGEYEAGSQLALVSDWKTFETTFLHSAYQMLANNGMWYFLCTLIAVLAIRWAIRTHPALDSSVPLSPDAAASSGAPGERLALATTQIFVLLALMAVFQLLTQSLRAVATLPRYFMMAYPSLAVPVVWGVWHSFPRRRLAALVLLVVFLGGMQVAKWDPRRWSRWPNVFHHLVANPTFETPSNHEWSLGFVRVLKQTKTLGKKLDRHIQPGQYVGGDWPFHVYLTDPRFGLVQRPSEYRDPGFLEWWRNIGHADFIVVHETHPFHHPPSDNHPYAEGVTLLKWRTGAVGSLSLYRYDPPPPSSE